MTKTHPLFNQDAYMSTCEAQVIAINERGGIILSQTCFYATSGGQPGDMGYLLRQDGSKIEIAATINGETKADFIHVPTEDSLKPAIDEKLTLHIDWPRRYKLMQMHTACHLLSVVCPYPITGAAVGENESRVDFDMSDTIDKADVTKKMMELIEQDHPIFIEMISESQLDANPDLIKSKNVKPPRGVGDIRLVCIGEGSQIDSQPCGGTHVNQTKEVGSIHIGKIEKKGKENRRFRIRFGQLPQ
jgi:misacylated tRNA(Ala) deacylase